MTSLQDLVDRALFISVEQQRAFEEYLQPDSAAVNFSVPSIRLHGEPPLDTTPYLLGTSSTSRGNWVWSWQEPEHFPLQVVAAAEAARQFGVEHGVPELAEAEVALTPRLDERLVLAAKSVTGLFLHYTASAGAGTSAWILLNAPALRLAEPTAMSVGRTLAEGLHGGLAANHRAAVAGYAQLRGLHLDADGNDVVVLSAADGAVVLNFSGDTISGIDVAESRMPAGWQPESVPVVLVEPEVVEAEPVRTAPVQDEPVAPEPVRTAPEPVREPVAAEPEPTTPMYEQQPEPAQQPEPVQDLPAAAEHEAAAGNPNIPAADQERVAPTPHVPAAEHEADAARTGATETAPSGATAAPRPDKTQRDTPSMVQPEPVAPDSHPAEPQVQSEEHVWSKDRVQPAGEEQAQPESDVVGESEAQEEEPERRRGFFGRLFGR